VSQNTATPASSPTVVLHIEPLFTDSDVWLDLEVPTSITLAALHEAMNEACEFEAEGAYAFYMNNRFLDRVFNYDGDISREGGKTSTTKLDGFKLPLRKRFAYVADVDQDYRCEVTVIALGEVQANVEYPRVTASKLDDEELQDPEQLPLTERAKLDDLATRIKGVLSTKQAKPSGGKGPKQPKPGAKKDLAAEAALAMAVLALVDALGVSQVFGYFHVTSHLDEQRVQSWLATLDERLGDAELFLQAAQLDERLAVAFRAPEILPQVPRWLLWAGEEHEATARLEELLDQYPEDATMLYYAGLFYLDLEDPEAAERYLTAALHWAGSELEEREQIVAPLVDLLEEAGRTEEAQRLREGEKKPKPGRQKR
jgi:tetratricopeptide (TPR) repeat protein